MSFADGTPDYPVDDDDRESPHHATCEGCKRDICLEAATCDCGRAAGVVVQRHLTMCVTEAKMWEREEAGLQVVGEALAITLGSRR
jgi:hypothetical protein